jgi:pilus assembly protein CpaB
MTPGRANKRFLLLALVLGVIGAILVYVTFSRSDKTNEAAPVGDTPVVVAKQDIAARTEITRSMLETRLVNKDAVAATAYSDPELVVGQVTRFPIETDEQITSSKVVPKTGSLAGSRSLSFVIPQGMRAMAVNVSEVINGGGLVLPGDYVDVLVTFDVDFAKPNDPTSRETFYNYFTETLLQNVEVLAVSQGVVDIVESPDATPTANGQRVRNSEDEPRPGAATVTLALTPEQAQILFNAELNGRIRMAVRAFGDGATVPLDYQLEQDLIPRDLPNPFQQR